MRGIDVSHHQGPIDWVAVAAAGTSFAFIKATEGCDHLDTRFAENWRGAAAAGIARGAYHFFTFCTPGVEQAEHFLRVAPPQRDVLPPVADVEFPGNCTSWTDLEVVARELSHFMERVERAWGVRCIVYVNDHSFEKIVRDVLDHRPLWVRNVFWDPGSDAYGGCVIWQYAENGRIPGIDGPVDLNFVRAHGGLTTLGSARDTPRGFSTRSDLDRDL